jgi:hypothetical protein
MRSVLTWCLAVTILLASSSASLAMDPSVRCQVDKLKIASKYLSCRLKAEAKAAKRFTAADVSECDAAFFESWGTAEERSLSRGVACWTTGDAATMHQAMAAYCDALAHGLSQDAGQK